MANELRFKGGDLFFVEGDLAMSEACNCSCGFASCEELMAATSSIDIAVIGGTCGGSANGFSTVPDCSGCSDTISGFQLCFNDSETGLDIGVFRSFGGLCIGIWGEPVMDWSTVELDVPFIIDFVTTTGGGGCGAIVCPDIEVTFNS